MVRTVITPANTSILVSIPIEYIGKPIEITCLSLEELEEKPSMPHTMSDFFGTIPDDTYQELKAQTEQARKEWNRGF